MGIETVLGVGSALVGGVGSLVGANASKNAAKDAAAAQSDAAQKQVDLSKEIYYDQRGLQQPYYQAGLQGMYGNNGLMNLLGFTTPSGQTASVQPANQNQPGNAFNPSQYASGSYGTTQIGAPTPTSGPNWQAYGEMYPEIVRYYQNNPKALAKFNGDMNKALEYHYNTYGKAQGFQLPQYEAAPSQNAFAGSGGQGTGQVGTAQPVDTGTPAATADPTEGPMTQTLRQTPGHQFLMDEAERSVANSFAARGKLLSGASMKALQDRAMGLADTTYQNAVNNNFQLANLGMGSAAQITNAGNNFANNASNAFYNQGQAAANGAYGSANAFNAGLQGVYGSAMGGLGMYGAIKNGWGS